MSGDVHRTHRVAWSVEDGGFVATIGALPSVSLLGAEQVVAIRDADPVAGDVVGRA